MQIVTTKLEKYIYMFDEEAAFELNGHIRCLQVLYFKINNIY